MSNDEIKLEIKKGFNYYCESCNESYRYASLVGKKEKITEMFIWLTCPKCGETVTDLKRKQF